MSSKIKSVLKRIEELRQKMVTLEREKGKLDPDVVKASQELDIVLNQYYRLLPKREKRQKAARVDGFNVAEEAPKMTFEAGEITAYCYMVQRGKPAALLAIQERDIDEAIGLIEKLGLKSYKEKLADGWISLWIYKYPHILEVIKSTPQEPRTVAEHWMLGKLFGYEEAAIQEYLAAKTF